MRTALTLVGIVLAMILEILDITIVNVALPQIQGNLGVDVDTASFVVTGYIVANVIVVPLTPWLQTRFGTRNYYVASILIFTFASAMCGLATSFAALVLWRIVQGLGGGGLISSSQTILRSIFPPERQGTAQGFFAAGTIVGPTAGPILGGWITENASWQWCFFVNVPVGLLAAGLCGALLANERVRRAAPLDLIGTALMVVGLGALQYVLDQGERNDWFDDPTIRMLSIASAASLAAFVYWVLHRRDPVVDLRVLRFRGVSAGSAIAAVLGVALFGTVLIIPQYTQVLLGFTPLGSGLVLTSRAIAMAASLPLAVIVARRADPRWQMLGGLATLGLSTLWLAQLTTSNTPAAAMEGALALSGFALANVFIPLQLSIFAGLGPQDVPKAAAFFNLSRQLGGGIATAVLVTLLDHNTAAYRSALAGNVTLQSPAIAELERQQGTSRAATTLNTQVQRESQALAFAEVTRLSGIITLVMVPLPLLLARPKRPEPALPRPQPAAA